MPCRPPRQLAFTRCRQQRCCSLYWANSAVLCVKHRPPSSSAAGGGLLFGPSAEALALCRSSAPQRTERDFKRELSEQPPNERRQPDEHSDYRSARQRSANGGFSFACLAQEKAPARKVARAKSCHTEGWGAALLTVGSACGIAVRQHEANGALMSLFLIVERTHAASHGRE
jgi:hypothetical protein